jgi:pyruvate kinase
MAREKGFIENDDYVINLTSMPVKEKGMVNTMRVTQIE